MPRALFSRRQEGLDGETVARLAAVHGTRPNPAGPAGGRGRDRRLRRSSSFSLVSVSQSFRSPSGDGGGGSSSCRRSSWDLTRPSSQSSLGCGGGGCSSVVSEVAGCLGEWWSSNPAQRPAAALAAEQLEAAAAVAATTTDKAADQRRSSTSLSLPAAFRPHSLPQPSPSSRAGRLGAGGLCACWGRAGSDHEED